MDVVHYSHLLHEQPVSTAMHLGTSQAQNFGYKLHNAAQIVTISSNLSKSKMGISCFNILNVLRVAVFKDRESAVSDPFGESLIFCPKLALGRLFSKIIFKSSNDFVYL